MVLFSVLTALASLGIVTGHGEFTHHTVLKDSVYFLSWKFDNETITFETQVRTTGYVGLGFSPNGGMAGADFIIGWVKDGTAYLTDRYATQNQQPIADDRQDVELISGSENGTFTTLRFRRRLHTCDDQDNSITQDTMRVIWSFHDSDPQTEMGLSYHGNVNRGAKSMFLLEPADSPVKTATIPDDAYTIDMINRQVQVPSNEDTTYWCSGFKLPTFDSVHHMIKAEPIVQPGHEALVHHIVVYVCTHQFNFSEHEDFSQDCGERRMPPDLQDCPGMLLAWAIGGEDQVFPEHVGFPFGGKGDPTFLLLQTHYDNPSLRNDYVDSSGLRFTFIPRRRQMDAGLLDFGALVGRNHLVPPHYDVFTTWGQCSACMEKALEDRAEGIHVFAAFLHTHLAGTAIYARHIRNGTELPYIAYDTNYDFNYQEYRYLKTPVTVLPTDGLVADCIYKTKDRTEITWGGLSTREEMCLAFLLYYPRVNLTTCVSAPLQSEMIKIVPQVETSSSNGGYSITVQSPSQYAGRRFQDVMESLVNWTDEATRETFQALELNSSRLEFCTGNNGFSEISGMERLHIKTPYVLPQPSCPATTTSTVGPPARPTVGDDGSSADTPSLTMATVFAGLIFLLLGK